MGESRYVPVSSNKGDKLEEKKLIMYPRGWKQGEYVYMFLITYLYLLLEGILFVSSFILSNCRKQCWKT